MLEIYTGLTSKNGIVKQALSAKAKKNIVEFHTRKGIRGFC